MPNILGLFAEIERSLTGERVIAGQVAAYRCGIRWGGQPRAASAAHVSEIHGRGQTGLFTIPTRAAMFGAQ